MNNGYKISKAKKCMKSTKIKLTEPPSLQVAAGILIKKLRCELGISGAKLGHLIGISQQQVSRYESGTCDLSLSYTEAFANALGLTLWQFMDELFEIIYAENEASALFTPCDAAMEKEITARLLKKN